MLTPADRLRLLVKEATPGLVMSETSKPTSIPRGGATEAVSQADELRSTISADSEWSRGGAIPPAPSPLKYRTIVADPPWPIKWRQSPGIGTRHLHYATMPVTEIASLPVLDLADDDGCSMFLWTTNGFLPEALGIVRLWKFEYRFLWTWCKPTGLGGHPRIATEHIVVAHRGQVRQQLDRRSAQTLNWHTAPATTHSVKPEKFLDLIESVSEGPYLEMFARRNRIGWDTWGNEALKHVELVS